MSDGVGAAPSAAQFFINSQTSAELESREEFEQLKRDSLARVSKHKIEGDSHLKRQRELQEVNKALFEGF